MSRDEAEAWLRLTLLPGIPPLTQRALLHAFTTPDGVLAASRARVARVTDESVATLLAQGPDRDLLLATLSWLEAQDHHLLAIGAPDYPQALLHGVGDPPVVIYAAGRLELLNREAIAVVGSRNATPQGRQNARAFAHALSEAELTIVSGLALGIDAEAHRGGLEGRGSSVAVLGTGPDRIYPKDNRALAHELARDGCLITEFALGMPPRAENFPRRNRLISGLARAVLVVEAAERSGSLVTAQLAGEQGRDVFAIPGSIHSTLAKGCHKLIKQGAKLVDHANDILIELGRAPLGAEAAPMQTEGGDGFLDAMGFDPVTVDQLVERTGKHAAAIGADLTRLQIEGRIAAMAGGRFQQVDRKARGAMYTSHPDIE
jgi:DNA processing protein